MKGVNEAQLIAAAHQLPEEEKLLALSCLEVQRSMFWSYMETNLNREVYQAMARSCLELMKGDDDKARVEAAKVQAYEWLANTMQSIISGLATDVQNQDEEDEYAA